MLENNGRERERDFRQSKEGVGVGVKSGNVGGRS